MTRHGMALHVAGRRAAGGRCIKLPLEDCQVMGQQEADADEAEEEDAALPVHTVAWKTMLDAVIAPLSAPDGGAAVVAGDGARAGRARYCVWCRGCPHWRRAWTRT